MTFARALRLPAFGRAMVCPHRCLVQSSYLVPGHSQRALTGFPQAGWAIRRQARVCPMLTGAERRSSNVVPAATCKRPRERTVSILGLSLFTQRRHDLSRR